MYDEMTNPEFIRVLAEKAHPTNNPSAEHADIMDEAARRIRKLERERNEIAALVRRLFQLLETVEVSDSDREFHPTRIQSCRVMHTVELGELLPKLKEAAK